MEVKVNNGLAFRRNLKRWGQGKSWWFIDLTASACRQAEIETGDEIQLSITAVADDLPAELQSLIQNDAKAQLMWQRKTPSQRRMLKDYVFAAKQSATRTRREKKMLQVDD